ncbi:MAG: YrhB family protein [Deltaproteobacteria bacterium]|nr:YrhB family protein [Deltaproteobacteria bacterium]
MGKFYWYGGAFFAFIFFLILGFFIARSFLKGKGARDAGIFLKATSDKDEAARSLLVYLNGDFKRSNKEIALYDGTRTSDGRAWIFFWDTLEFIRTKNPAFGLKGSNPVLYDKETGRIQFIPQHEVFKYFGEKKPDNA